MAQALEGVKIADFSQLMQGPWATQKLADMGADVIKIEPIGGELEREVPAMGRMYDEKSPFYLAMNRNKRSLTVDLKSDEGIEAVLDLIERSDVLVENFRPGVMDRLGLGYEDVTEENENIIYVSASGFGSTGPYADRPGQDLLAQAMSGKASITGRRDDPPMPAGTFIADELSATLIALHVAIALYYRERTGTGQRIEANLLDAMIDALTQEITSELTMEESASRSEAGIGHAYMSAPYGYYETEDGYVAISMSPPAQLGETLDIEQLKEYSSQEEVYDDRDEIKRLVEERTKEFETDEVLELFSEADIWASDILTIEEMADDPQVAHNEMIVELEDPDVGTYKTTGLPVTMSETPGRIESTPPRAGEHTEEVLTEIGYSESEARELAESDAFGGS